MNKKAGVKAGVNVDVTRRREWVQSARGSKVHPVTSSVSQIVFYHRDIDELGKDDPPERELRRVPLEWEAIQPTVRQWFADLLQHRHYAIERAAAISQNDKKKTEGKKKKTKAVQSDWEEEFEQARLNGGFATVEAQALNPGPRWKGNNMMPDKLYLALVKTLLADDPYVYLEKSLKRDDAALHKLVERQLREHARYHLFWVDVELYDAALSPAGRPTAGTQRWTRLVPVLYRVSCEIHTDSVTIQDCRRCIPMSQIPLLLDSFHSGRAHLRDSHETIQAEWCGVPRKAIRLFAAKCHACTKVDKKKRNTKRPQTINANYVRERYTLDRIDMETYQDRAPKGSSASKLRYVAQMIDHCSKHRWATAIAHKTAEEVQEFVRQVFTHFGHPALLHTDNGTEFANQVLTEECRAWGTYMIHGKPYTPQTQGVVERVNGAVKKAMKKMQLDRPTCTDWPFLLSQAIISINQQVHSVTHMRPADHFKMDCRTRVATPIPADQPVLLTLAQLKVLPALRWITPTDVEPYIVEDPLHAAAMETSTDSEAEQADAMTDDAAAGQDGVGHERTGTQAADEVTPEPGMDMEQQPEPEKRSAPTAPDSSEGDEDDGDGEGSLIPAPASTTPPQSAPLQLARTQPARKQPVRTQPPPSLFRSSQSSTSSTPRPKVTTTSAPKPNTRSNPAGQTMPLGGAAWEEDDAMGHIPQYLQRVKTLANGDCGPAAAYFALHGQVASTSAAAKVRTAVHTYGTSAEGQVYYAMHQAAELSLRPMDLSVVLGFVEGENKWVTIEFFTLFGGMEGLNVFVLARSEHADGSTTVNITLVTNGRVLVQRDKEDCVCIYFSHTHSGYGHFEAVADKSGRHRWRADDHIVESVLMMALLKKKIAVSVRDARKKQLTAATNRIDAANETIKVGDLAWLIVPAKAAPQVVLSLKKQNKLKNTHLGDDGLLLVKIGGVHSSVERSEDGQPAPPPVLHFIVYTIDGRLKDAVTIDCLKRAHPPPEATTYPTVECISTEEQLRTAPEKKRLTITQAYRKYLVLLDVRLEAQKALERKGLRVRQLTVQANAQTAAATELAAELRRTTRAATLAASSAPSSRSESPVIFPCTLCNGEVAGKELVHCFYPKCMAPFHMPNTSCTQPDRLVVVETILLYCSQSCASQDNKPLLTRRAAAQLALQADSL